MYELIIVGAGPAGMSAALELAKMGYRPTVFERFDVAGGILATAIPKYRLPREVLQQDIDWICAHGVELRTGVEIGVDKTIDDLRAEGFQAVLIATGLANSRMLTLPGASYLAALAKLGKLDLSTGAEILTIVAFNLIMLLLLEVPLLGFALAPEKTNVLVGRFSTALSRHGGRIARASTSWRKPGAKRSSWASSRSATASSASPYRDGTWP